MELDVRLRCHTIGGNYMLDSIGNVDDLKFGLALTNISHELLNDAFHLIEVAAHGFASLFR